MKPEWFSQWVSPVEKVASRYLARLEVPSRGQWVSAPPEKLDSLQADRLWQMYHLSYGNIGMHVPSLQALLADHDLLWVTDIDGDGEFDAFIAYKKSPAGNKLALMGSDGSSASKRATITKCVELLKSPGWYAELSHRPAQLMEQAGVSKIDDEELVRNTLRKPLEWLGDGQYVRTIGSLGAVTKSLYGHPRGASSHNRILVKLAKEPSYQKKKKVKKQDGGEMTVYEYSDRQISTRNKDKAERIEKLRHGIDGLRKQVKKDLKSDDEHTRDVALAIGLMDVTYERVGNDQSAKDGHFGVTGWKVKHLTMGKGKVTVKYVGKSGVDHEKVIDKAESVTAIKAAIKGKKPNDEVCGGVSAEDVNGYLKKFDVTAKDIRGYHANTEMQDRLKAVRAKGGKLPSDKKELAKKLKEEFKQALEETAEAVGHEPATLKSQYLVPGLEDEFLTNGKVSEKLTKKGSKTANYLSIPASFLAERGWEFGNAEWRDQGNLKGEALQSWLEKQLPKLSVPVDIEINKDGTIDFQDGHHRVRAAMLINSDVLVKVKHNKLDPNVWTEYLDRINKGFTYREINPDGENLNRRGIPSVDALKAGRHSGLRDSELFEFYVHFDGHQDSGKKTGVSGGAKGKSASILQGMRSEEQVHREKFISSGKNPYGTRCPICDLPARSSCRCKVGDKTCPNGHTWVRCPVHKTRIVFHQSTHDGSLILEYGTCWCNLGGDVYPPDDPAPVPPVTNLVSRYLAKRIVQ